MDFILRGMVFNLTTPTKGFLRVFKGGWLERASSFRVDFTKPQFAEFLERGSFLPAPTASVVRIATPITSPAEVISANQGAEDLGHTVDENAVSLEGGTTSAFHVQFRLSGRIVAICSNAKRLRQEKHAVVITDLPNLVTQHHTGKVIRHQSGGLTERFSFSE